MIGFLMGWKGKVGIARRGLNLRTNRWVRMAAAGAMRTLCNAHRWPAAWEAAQKRHFRRRRRKPAATSRPANALLGSGTADQVREEPLIVKLRPVVLVFPMSPVVEL